MDSYEATKVVFSRIQTLDPENASKIMGYLLLQDHSEKEMIRLAFGPETHLHNLILKAKTHLGLSPTNPTNPISRPNPLSLSSSSSSSSSRITNNGGFDITNPSSPSSNNPWPYNKFSTPALSYANVVKETGNIGSGSSLSSAFQYNSSDLIDEYQLQDHLSFLNDSKTDDLFDPRLELAYADSPLQRQSYLSSAPGMCFGSEDASSGGLGWKPCLYFARGFCKNGSSCRFLHGDSGDSAAIVGSPSKLNEFEQCQELLRSKAAHQQKLAAGSQFMAGASFPYNKYMNFLMQQQNDNTQRSAAAAALMMGDELHKFGRCRAERNDFSAIGLGGMVNPGSRQIYLTFPADSTFREEDVSNYFSNYGPVQDVRIPYQQKRMFGFVTFLYPDTVKIILAKGNPHFVCDSRVLVKPYKEKGKIPDKKQQQQQLERGEYLACSSPPGLDSRESFDLQLGTRMFYNTQEMLLRRKLEEHADLQQAIELQGRRLMNLQLLDLKNHRYHPHQYHHNLSVGSPSSISSPTLTHGPNNQTLVLPPDGIDQQVPTENSGKPGSAVSHTTAADADQQLQQEVNPGYTNGNVNGIGKEDKSNPEESDLHECLEHSLPDSLFACPKDSAGDHLTAFSTASSEEPNENTSTASSTSNNSPLMPTTSPLTMASLKNVFSKSSGFLLGMECS